MTEILYVRPRRSSPETCSRMAQMPIKKARRSSPDTQTGSMADQRSLEEFGFFGFNLRFLCEVDTAEKQYMRDEQELELQWSHPCVHPVIKNIMAILRFTMPLFKTDALAELEKVHEEHPKNLNTLANLLKMRKELKQDFSDIEDKLRQVMREGNQIEIARAELEKGYVFLMDLHSECKATIGKQLQQVNDQLKLQIVDEQNNLRGQLERVLGTVEEAQKLMSTIPASCTLTTKHGRYLAVKNFESGLKKLREIGGGDTIDEETVWRHYLGKTYNRLGTTDKTVERTGSKKNNYHKAIRCFSSVIEHLSPRFENLTEDGRDDVISRSLRNCLARTYAYMGHLIQVKQKIVFSNRVQSLPEEHLTAELRENPMIAFEKAKQINTDRVVLNKYALTLLRDMNPKFEEAEKYLSQSLDHTPETNWYAFHVRTILYIKWYQSQMQVYNRKPNQQTGVMQVQRKPDDDLLRKCIESGRQCLQLRTTSETLMNIAKAYFYLGIDPSDKCKKNKIVRGKENIQNALMFIQRAKDRHQCSHHSEMYALLGKCLFHLGHMSEATDQMQQAIETERENIKDPLNFRNFCKFLLEEYKQYQNKNYGRCEELIKRLWLMIGESEKKYKKRIDYQLIGIANEYPHEMFHMINHLIREKSQHGPDTERIVKKLLGNLSRHNGPRVKQRAREIEQLIPINFREYNEGEEQVNTAPESTTDQSNIQDKKFRFYVGHSKRDNDWVHDVLMKHIEGDGQMDRLCQIKGCLRGRDISKDEAIETIIQSCEKFVFVLSGSFSKNRRCITELQAIRRHLQERNEEIRLIPLLIGKEGDIPLSENIYYYIDFSKPPYEFDKLRRAILDIDEGMECDEKDEGRDEEAGEQEDDQTMECDGNGQDEQMENATLNDEA